MMAASLKILVPEATKNYIENPSFRYDTTGWHAINATMTRALESHHKTSGVVQGVTISRTLTYKLYGVSAVEVVTDGLSLNEGIFYRVNDIAEGGKLTNEPVTVSAYVRGSGRVRIRLWAGTLGEWASEAISLSTLYWKRLEVSGSLQTQYGDVRLYVETDDIAQAVP